MSRFGSSLAALFVLALASEARAADEFEQDPINYSATEPQNQVSELQARLERGEAKLPFDPEHGYLPAVLEALRVPVSSQTLVFSKTSLQRNRISPRTPRALYFNDDVYVGFCVRGEVMEVSATDDQLGTVFYTLAQKEVERPTFVRQTDNCLLCHASSQTQGIPGHLVRSVYADHSGQPLLAMGTKRVDQTTPLADRWGGWYVTGRHGAQTHLGNLVLSANHDREPVDNRAGQNVVDLADRFDTSAFLSPHSDLVALMVLEHQTSMHNCITRANFLVRQANYFETAVNRELGRPAGTRSETAQIRIRAACEPLVKYLLYAGEAKLAAPISGTTDFAAKFAAPGPRDARGRSLRDLDLTRRMFRHPCSYLIYSSAFQQLPADASAYVWRRLDEILSGKDQSPEFAHLSAEDRQAVREILAETHPQAPKSWQPGAP